MHYDLTDAVLTRPKMYTLRGSYPEILAFLEGYYSGLAKLQSDLTVIENWSSFQQGLAEKLDVSPSDVFLFLADTYESDALKTFDRFYREFKVSNRYSQP